MIDRWGNEEWKLDGYQAYLAINTNASHHITFIHSCMNSTLCARLAMTTYTRPLNGGFSTFNRCARSRVYSATRTFQTPFEVTLIMVQIRPRLRPIERLSQPVFEFRRGGQLFLELLRHGFGVHVQVFPQEGPDLGVLVVADEGTGVFGVGGVDVHVDG